MRQLKTPIIGVLAASIMVLSNPSPANATSIADDRTEFREPFKGHEFNSSSWRQFESGNGFSDLFLLHTAAAPAGLNVWSSRNWHGTSDAFFRKSKEVVVATPEPSSLLELATVSLLSTGLWFWRRRSTAQSSPLNTVWRPGSARGSVFKSYLR
jgi:hypothetical protein